MVNEASNIPQIQEWNNKKRYGNFSKLRMKTPDECQCFFMSSSQWGHSGQYSCMWICFYIYLPIIYFICCTARYTMRLTHIPTNIARSTKLRGTQRSPELAFRSTDFCVPENLIFLALLAQWMKSNSKIANTIIYDLVLVLVKFSVLGDSFSTWAICHNKW